MNADYAKLSPDGQAVAYFDDAANRFRGYFESEVLAALPDFTRRALQLSALFRSTPPSTTPSMFNAT